MDWLDLLAVQGTLKTLFQHHNWKASILQCSAFIMVHLSHPYTTTESVMHPTISSSVNPFSSHLQSFPASGSFQMSQFFPSGGQSTGVCFSISPSNEYSGLIFFTIDWSDHQSRDSQKSSPTPQFKSINSSSLSFLHSPTLTSIHDHWKNHSLD